MDVLFKIHEDSSCLKLQNVVRYLYNEGYDVRPKAIIERNFPPCIDTDKLPIIIINNRCITGLHDIVTRLELLCDISELLERSEYFAKCKPDYRIQTDRKKQTKKL